MQMIVKSYLLIEILSFRKEAKPKNQEKKQEKENTCKILYVTLGSK